MYGITVVTDHTQFSEAPNPIIKCENCNRRPIQNCKSDYQMQIHTVGSALIIGRIILAFIKGTRSSDTIYYLPRNQCEVNLNEENTYKSNGLQFIWPGFYWSILRCKYIRYYYTSKFIWGGNRLGWRKWWFDLIALKFPEY